MTISVSDTFTDTDSTALADHTPDTDLVGSGWIEANGSLIISGNKLQPTGTNFDSVKWVAAIEASSSDCTVSADVTPTTAGTSGIAFRYVDVDNFWCVLVKDNGQVAFFDRSGGSFSSLGTYTIPTFSGTTTLSATCSGTSIEVFVDGVSRFTTTSSTRQTATMHGVRIVDNSDTIDNFEVDGTLVSSVTVTSSRVGSSSADMTFSGNYVDSGSATKVQVKVLLESDDSTVVDWTDVDVSLAGGTWTGTLTVPAGGPYYSQARLVDGSLTQYAIGTSSQTFLVGVVIVAIGQSNTESQGTNLQTYSGTAAAWIKRESTALDETLNDPWSDRSSKGSWGVLLANLIDADNSGGLPIIYIVAAQSGTGLSSSDPDWLPPSGTNWLEADGLVDGLSLNAVDAALWLQGERDAALGASLASYESAEETLATAVAAWPGSPSLISTLIGHNTNVTEANIDPIRRAKISNWDDGDTKPGANPIDIDLTDGTGDGLHYETDTELAILAGRIWLALDDAIFSGTNGRGPIISTVTGQGTSTLTITFDKDLDTDDTTYTASLFTVDNDTGSAVTVSAATRTGTRTVDLTMSGAVDGTAPTLTFADGNNAAGSTMPKTSPINLPTTINSVSAVALPAEPAFAVSVGSAATLDLILEEIEAINTALVALSSAVTQVDTVVDAILAGQGVSVDATSPFTNGDNLSAFTNDTTTYAFTVSVDYTSGWNATLIIQKGDDETAVFDRISCTIASATSITAEFDYSTWTTTPTFTTGCNSKVATLKWFLVVTTAPGGDDTTIASGGFYLHARGTTSA